jgi:hypothetical protein
MRVLPAALAIVLWSSLAHAAPITFSATGQLEVGNGSLYKLGIPTEDVFSVTFTIEDYQQDGALYRDVPLSVVGSNWSFDTDMVFRMSPERVTSHANIAPYTVTAPNMGWILEPGFTSVYTSSGSFTDPTAQWRMHFYFLNDNLPCNCSGDASADVALSNVTLTEQQSIPEPSTWLLLSGGALFLLPHLTRRR